MQTVASSEKIALLHTQARAFAQLRAVRQRYVSRYSAAVLLPTLAAGLLLAGVVHHWPTTSPLAVGFAVLGILTANAWLAKPLVQLDQAAVARQLDRQLPELEDSTGLLLQDPGALPLLGRLQYERVAQQLAQLTADGSAALPFSFKKSLLLSALLLVSAAVFWLLPPGRQHAAEPAAVAMHFNADQPQKAAKPTPARIEQVRLLVTPPAYTRRPAFVPAQASFRCPQGARVRWEVQVSGAAKAEPVLEIGPKKLPLRPVAGQAGTFAAEQVLGASTLYRLRYAGQVSDDYAIEVQADEVPVVRILSPKPYTLIAAVSPRP